MAQPAPPEPIDTKSLYIGPTGPTVVPTGPIERPTGLVRQPESAGFNPDFSRELSKKVYTFLETYCLKGPENFD